jgi:septum formation protein
MRGVVIAEENPLLLGSASPRRRDILQGLGIPIRVSPADIVEDVKPGESAEVYLERIVQEKLVAVAERVEGQRFAAILVADTSVVLDGRILGKPADVEAARELVTALAGRTHVVLTRYAAAHHATPSEVAFARTVATRVTLRAASANEIARYAATGEGLDKAGAYAAQGLGAFLVERIDGSYSNVVGLPACELVSDLLAAGMLAAFP